MKKKYKKPKKYIGLKKMIEKLTQDTLYAQGAYQPDVPSKEKVDKKVYNKFVKKVNVQNKPKPVKNPIKRMSAKQISTLISSNDN